MVTNKRFIVNTIRRIIKETNLVHLTILRNGQTFLSIPITISMVLFYLYPILTMLSTVYLINKRFTIKILKLTL